METGMELMICPAANVILECNFAVLRYMTRHNKNNGSEVIQATSIISGEILESQEKILDEIDLELSQSKFVQQEHVIAKKPQCEDSSALAEITIVSPDNTNEEHVDYEYEYNVAATTKACSDAIEFIIQSLEQSETFPKDIPDPSVETTIVESIQLELRIPNQETFENQQCSDNNFPSHELGPNQDTETLNQSSMDDQELCTNEDFYNPNLSTTKEESKGERRNVHVIDEENMKTESEYTKLWAERKTVLEKRAETKAKSTFQAWQRDKLSLEEIIDNSLKDYVELYERAHAMRLQFEAEKSSLTAKVHHIMNAKFMPQNQEQFQYFIENDYDYDANKENADENDMKRKRDEEDESFTPVKFSKRKFSVPNKQK